MSYRGMVHFGEHHSKSSKMTSLQKNPQITCLEIRIRELGLVTNQTGTKPTFRQAESRGVATAPQALLSNRNQA